jgi:hypothetical protein
MPNEEINKTKQKIMDWLKEEGFSAEEKQDPNAYFNIQATKGGMGVNIVQNPPFNDSFFIGGNIAVNTEQQTIFKSRSREKREDFIWDLQINLLTNNELGDFMLKPNPPNDLQVIFISSRRIYFDELTKGKFLAIMNIVMKSVIMSIWKLQKFTGMNMSNMVAKKEDYSR